MRKRKKHGRRYANRGTVDRQRLFRYGGPDNRWKRVPPEPWMVVGARVESRVTYGLGLDPERRVPLTGKISHIGRIAQRSNHVLIWVDFDSLCGGGGNIPCTIREFHVDYKRAETAPWWSL